METVDAYITLHYVNMASSQSDSTRNLILYPPTKIDTTHESPIWVEDLYDIENVENNVHPLLFSSKFTPFTSSINYENLLRINVKLRRKNRMLKI